MTGILTEEKIRHREKTMRRHWKIMAILQQRRETSEEINPADALISDF